MSQLQIAAMLFTYMTYSAYELYVALLDALISVAVALSVVVSLDRVFHVMKYMQLKTRSRVTGRKPEDYYQFSQLPGEGRYFGGTMYILLITVASILLIHSRIRLRIFDSVHVCLHWPPMLKCRPWE